MNLRGELGSTALCLAGTTLIKLFSSVVLTGFLYPEAYGLVTIVLSIAFVVSMLSELGEIGFMIRHESGDEPAFIHTMWTLRLLRNCVICLLLMVGAPLIAQLYDTPSMVGAMRIYAITFLISGLESMSLVMALRYRRVNIVNMTELLALFGSTLFVLVFSYFQRDHMGMIYGMVLNRVLVLVLSYCHYRELKPRFMLDRHAINEIFAFAKIVMPTSMITLCLSQFDRVIFLRLFNLELLGYYGIASNLLAPVETASSKVSRFVLLPRAAEVYRTDRENVRARYYQQNVKLFLFIMFLPAAVGGASSLIVEILFDSRYVVVGTVLMVCSIRAILGALAYPPENLLMASGHTQVLLISQLWRLAWLLGTSYVGYLIWGFYGFLIFVMLDQLPAWIYLLWKQGRAGIVVWRYEALKVAFIGGVFVSAFAVAQALQGQGVALRAYMKHLIIS